MTVVVTGKPPPRSRAALLFAVDALDVEHSSFYAPTQNLSFCNFFVSDLMRRLGVPLPRMLANEQIRWLEGPMGFNAGWRGCTSVEAAIHAETGGPAVAGWENLKGHGHIAVVVPAIGGAGIHIAQAGAHCFANASVLRGFGDHPVTYWKHQ